MDAEQDYGFDVAGFIHLPGVLTADQVAACNRAIDAAGLAAGALASCDQLRLLGEHPVLQDMLKSLCGAEYHVDCPPSLVEPANENEAAVRLCGSDPDRSRRFRYFNHAGNRVCHGVRIVWALKPAPAFEGALVLVPCSHNRTLEPPADLVSGDDNLGLAHEPALEAGDLLICAATTLHGVRGQPGNLIQITFRSAQAMPSAGYAEQPTPSWMADLTPEQQALVGPRLTGRGATVLSDGQQAWRLPDGQEPPAMDDQRLPGIAPDPKELWFWDVRGYLVLKGVMDEAWLKAANRAIDAALEAQPSLPPNHPTAIEEVPEAVLRQNDGQWPKEASQRLRGHLNRPRIGGLYHLPSPHCDPIRKMIGHPAIVKRLNWMLGYGFKEIFEPMCTEYPTGTTGGSLHGQNSGSYRMNSSLPHVDQCNVAWALHDEVAGFGPDSGGFICVPGSHKASYAIPRPEAISIDLPQVYKPPLKAGDVLFFGGVAHGTTAWRTAWHRRTIIQFMRSGWGDVQPGRPRGWTWPSHLKKRSRLAAAQR